MRNKVVYFLSLIAVCSFVAGCEGPEQKLGRGINNSLEFARMGEIRRSMEQSAIFDTEGRGGVTTGIIHGIDRSFARTGAGIYEIVTFPIPNGSHGDYSPIYKPGNPAYPDSYKPDWMSDSSVLPDTELGFAGGDIAPFIPGSRFHIFDN